MAFHANQGPRMGLPQMIQSRAQFGIRGAVVPFIAVLFVYVGFNVFNVILATQGLQLVLPGGAVVLVPDPDRSSRWPSPWSATTCCTSSSAG